MSAEAESGSQWPARAILTGLAAFVLCVLAIVEIQAVRASGSGWGTLARIGVAGGLLTATYYLARFGFQRSVGRAAAAAVALVVVAVAAFVFVPQVRSLLGAYAEVLATGLVIAIVILLGRRAGWLEAGGGDP